MNQPPSPPKRHSFRPLLFAPPQGSDAVSGQVATGPSSQRPASSLATHPRGSRPASRPTSGQHELPARGAGDSHVRLRALPIGGSIDWLDAQELFDELCDDQIDLSAHLASIERSIEEAPRDPSARAALPSLEERIGDLVRLRDALVHIQLIAADTRLHRVFLRESAFADYLRGLYAWAHAVVRALEQLSSGLRKLQPDWALFRWRIEEAKNFHFDELEDPIRADLSALAVIAGGSPRLRPQFVGDLCVVTERLFVAAHALEESLDQRFG